MAAVKFRRVYSCLDFPIYVGKKTGMMRRETSFKNTGANTDKREVMTATGELAEMLKTLLTDKKTLQEELLLERQQRAEGSAKRDTNGPTTWTRGRNMWRGRR